MYYNEIVINTIVIFNSIQEKQTGVKMCELI